MRDFREVLEAYGVDYEMTMDRFMGNEALYMRLLDMLFQDSNLQKLGDALQAHDAAAAFEAAHTLKGVVGNMGLTPLYQAVCEIVEPLRKREQREDYPAMYQAVQAEFEKAKLLRDQLKGGAQT